MDDTRLDAASFEAAVRRRWHEAEKAAAGFVDVQAAEVHMQAGGYPGTDHRIPQCCAVMKRMMVPGDEVLSAPPSGAGATLLIRYRLPRLQDYSLEKA